MEEKIGRRERKKILSRKAILDAAVAQFSRKGFKETSVADIMNAADLGIGTFYNYFQSKEEILVQLMQEMMRETAEATRALRAANRPAGELLETGCRITAKFLDENRYVLPLFLSAADKSGLPEGSGKETKIPSPEVKGLFERILREGQEKGEFRADLPPELIAEMFHSIYQAAAFSRLSIPFQENIAMKTRLLLDGIRTDR